MKNNVKIFLVTFFSFTRSIVDFEFLIMQQSKDSPYMNYKWSITHRCRFDLRLSDCENIVLTLKFDKRYEITSKLNWWSNNWPSCLFLFLSNVNYDLFSQREFVLVFVAPKLCMINENEWCIVSNSKYMDARLLPRTVPQVDYNII